MSKDGTFLEELGRRSKHSGLLNRPTALAIDKDDNLFVACLGELVIIDSSRNIIQGFNIGFADVSSDAGFPDIGFRIRSIAVDTMGYVYVVGYGPHGVVHKFGKNGNWLKSFGEAFPSNFPRVRRAYSGGYLVSAKGNLYLNYLTPYRLAVHDLDGTLVGEFKRIDVDLSPRFVVTPTSSVYHHSSKSLKSIYIDGLLINQFYVVGQGVFADIFDLENGIVCKDFRLGPYVILSSDTVGNLYLVNSKRSDGPILRGRMTPRSQLQEYSRECETLDRW